MQACTSPCEQEQTSAANDRSFHDELSCDAALGHQAGKTHGCAKRGGRPVTWIGGGGLDPKKLTGLGVPVLRDLFKQVFGESTASNNAGWLRRKLSESPDNVHGQCRSRVVRARDSGAAIWNRPLIMLGVGEEAGDEELAAAEAAEGQGEAGGCTGGLQPPGFVKREADVEMGMLEAAGAAQGFRSSDGSVRPQHHAHRSLKRSCTEASQNFRERVAAARCPSPSASDSASPAATHQDGCISPWANSRVLKQQHRHHHTHTQQQQQQQQRSAQEPSSSGAFVNSSSMPGRVIHSDELRDDWVGCQVMVFWPADNRWWAAAICGLSTATQQLQLLYSDQTEEVVAGQDFCDLLRNGHLALAAGQAPPPNGATGYIINAHADNPAAAAAACGTAMLSAPGSLATMRLPGGADLAAAAAGSAPTGGLARRVPSCHMPASLAGGGSMASPQDFARSTSVSFGVSYGGSGVSHAAGCASVSGSGSGSGSGTTVDFEELAAKRSCCEPSINNTGSDGSNPGFYGFADDVMAAAEQQQQGPQASQLGAWFASQQRQQQQLQLQMQANLQLQQQVQMQIQHQVAAHMSMQQAAGQVMQLKQPALSSPFAGGGGPAAAAPTGFTVMPADLRSPFAVPGAYTSSRTPAAAEANMPVPCQQMPQLEVQRQQSASPVAAAAVASSSAVPTGQQHHHQQQQGLQPGTDFAGSLAVPKARDHVVSEAVAPQPGESSQQQAAAAAAAASAAFKLPQLNLQAPVGALQPASVNEIDGLLTKASRDIFELEDLAAAAGIGSIDGMEGMEEDAIAAACGLDSGPDALAGDACSSGNNSSLCESMADELAVAGLEAQDAAGYYMFGAAGSPTPGEQQELQQLQQQALRQGAAAAAGAGAGAGAGGCQGLVHAAGVQGMVRGEAAVAAAACGNAIQLAGNGCKVAQAPCESSFAHMFDFY